jgi:hypothetical protein
MPEESSDKGDKGEQVTQTWKYISTVRDEELGPIVDIAIVLEHTLCHTAAMVHSRPRCQPTLIPGGSREVAL